MVADCHIAEGCAFASARGKKKDDHHISNNRAFASADKILKKIEKIKKN